MTRLLGIHAYVCPDCHYIGDPRLCNCAWRLGDALRNGRLDEALEIHKRRSNIANAYLREKLYGETVAA